MVRVLKLPQIVKVGPFDYKVECLKPDEAKANRISGDCSPAIKRIRVDLNDDIPEAAETLIHEIWHAAYREFGLDLGDEEKAVARISKTLANIMRDNPGLMSKLDKAIQPQ